MNITTTDSGNDSFTQEVVVSILDVNDVPSGIVLPQGTEIAENAEVCGFCERKGSRRIKVWHPTRCISMLIYSVLQKLVSFFIIKVNFSVEYLLRKVGPANILSEWLTNSGKECLWNNTTEHAHAHPTGSARCFKKKSPFNLQLVAIFWDIVHIWSNFGEQNNPHPSLPLHSMLECLLFPTGSSKSGNALNGGDGERTASLSPFEVGKTSESALRAKCLYKCCRRL